MNVTDADGLTSPRECDPAEHWTSGNGIRYTSERALGKWRQVQADASKHVVAIWFRETIKPCFLRPGLFDRGPTHERIHADQESFDDYLAALSACRTLGIVSIANDVWDYGKCRIFIYHNGRKGNVGEWWSAFLLRFPLFMAALYGARCRRVPWPLLRLARYCVSLPIKPGSDGEHDSWAMRWHAINACPQLHGTPEALAFASAFAVRFPGGMGDVCFAACPEHPVREDLKGLTHPLG